MSHTRRITLEVVVETTCDDETVADHLYETLIENLPIDDKKVFVHDLILKEER